MAGDGGAPWDLPVDTELQAPPARGHPGIALTAAPQPAMRQARAPDFALWPHLLKGLSVLHRHRKPPQSHLWNPDSSPPPYLPPGHRVGDRWDEGAQRQGAAQADHPELPSSSWAPPPPPARPPAGLTCLSRLASWSWAWPAQRPSSSSSSL